MRYNVTFVAKKHDVPLFLLVLALVILLSSTFFVVDRTEVAGVFQMGKPIIGYNGVTEAGIKLKWPFPFQSVGFATNRYFIYDSSPKDTTTKDKKMLIVDEFMPARVVDPIKFFTTVKSVPGALSRIDDTAYSYLNNIIGQETYPRIVVEARDEILEKVTKITQATISDFGIASPMVRVSRVDLPPQNTEAVFNRMVSERQQEAAQYRAEGISEKMRISSKADMDAKTIREEARKTAQSILGAADAKAVKMFNDAASKNMEFFNFYFALDSAKQSLAENGAKEKIFILDGKEIMFKSIFE